MKNEITKEQYFEVMENVYEGDTSWMQEEPKRYTKNITGWAKKELLLDAWNKYLREQEVISERLGLKYHDVIGELPRYKVVQNFAHWLVGYMDSFAEEIEANEE